MVAFSRKIRAFALGFALLFGGFAFAEESGFFIGANTGYNGFKQVASGGLDIFGAPIITQKQTIKADSFSSGFLLGYKYFFNPFVGMRLYAGFDVFVPEFDFGGGEKEEAMLLNYGGNLDFLINFIAKPKVDFGLFAGAGIGGNWWVSKDITTAKRDFKEVGINVKDNVLDIAINAGLRVNIARRHGIEIGARVPLKPATLIDETRESNGVSVNIKMQYIQIYSAFMRYTFMF